MSSDDALGTVSEVAFRRYGDFILDPSACRVSVADATLVLAALDIDCRLVCRAGMSIQVRGVLTVVTADPDHVVTLQQSGADSVLEVRKQVGPESWEYEVDAAGRHPLAEFAVRLSRFGRHALLAPCAPLLTLAVAAGWGNDITHLTTDAVVTCSDLARAVASLFVDEARPNPPDRFRATAVLREHLRSEQ
jgi:hypothetical protein